VEEFPQIPKQLKTIKYIISKKKIIQKVKWEYLKKCRGGGLNVGVVMIWTW
jgi:hypothetical protein